MKPQPSPSPPCVALLSGGKDSVIALDTARRSGFSIVAALTLHPAQDDAWMFHTPNLNVVRGVAQALQVPLVEADVRADPQEEVIDLEAALRELRDAMGIDSVVVGALASEYQRTRIEAVCHRLGLRSFAPLWHKNPITYMEGIVAGGWDVRFSRTAAEGVPNMWAGERLDSEKIGGMQSQRAKPHLAGEGGEYESIVLSGPGMTGRVVVDQGKVTTTVSRATWNIQAWHWEP